MAGEFKLYRPAFVEPPLCTVLELDNVLTIDQWAVMNEIIDLKEAAAAKANAEAERDSKRGRR